MGCGGSKAKKQSDVVDPTEEELEVSGKVGGSEVKKRVHIVMALKARLQKATFEKVGVEYHLNQMREQLSRSSEVVQAAKDEYQNLLNYAMERDADELFRALTSNSKAEKVILIEVLTARTRWQMSLITEAYERKHNVPLLKIIKENLRTSMGVFTGTSTDLGKLLLYIAMEQPERDAQLLTQHVNNFDIIVEVVTTRSNRELKAALEYYHHTNGKSFADVMASKLYQNCGKLMKIILECKRSEAEEGYDNALAKDLCVRLDSHLQKKNAEEVIKLLANMSIPQFNSVNEAYMQTHKKKNVYQALSVFSGDFYQLLVARCTSKYHYLCSHLFDDKESTSRILGCLTRAECKTLRDCFDVNKDVYGNNRTLETVLRAEIKKESYLRACLNLVSTDTSNFPLGTDRELREDEVLVENVVKGVEQAAREAYDAERMRELGAEKAAELGVEVDMSKPKVTLHKGKEQTAACIAELDDLIQELKQQVRETEEEVTHKAELSFAVAAHLRQAEEWTALYETYASQLNSHIKRIDEGEQLDSNDSSRHSLLGVPVIGKIIQLGDKVKPPKNPFG